MGRANNLLFYTINGNSKIFVYAFVLFTKITFNLQTTKKRLLIKVFSDFKLFVLKAKTHR